MRISKANFLRLRSTAAWFQFPWKLKKIQRSRDFAKPRAFDWGLMIWELERERIRELLWKSASHPHSHGCWLSESAPSFHIGYPVFWAVPNRLWCLQILGNLRFRNLFSPFARDEFANSLSFFFHNASGEYFALNPFLFWERKSAASRSRKWKIEKLWILRFLCL